MFPDTVTGGGDFMQRPGMMDLLAFLDAHPTERFIVLFDDLKRYSRDVEFHLKLRREMAARGATPECLNFSFVNSPEGNFSEIIVAASGQLEREQNKRQTVQKMRARVERGYWVSNVPIGYRFENDPVHGKLLVPNPPFDGIIREAFGSFASGRFRSQAEVRRFFESCPEFPRNKKGVITQQRVTDILTHPIYTGHVSSKKHGLHWIKGHHEAIVSLATYDRVQERRKGSAHAPKRKNIGEAFALRGIVACGGCNVPLRSSITRGNGGNYPYYLCQSKSCDHYGKSIKRDKLEGDVGELVKALHPTKGLIELATAMFRKAWDTRLEQAKDRSKTAKRKIAALEDDMNALVKRIMATTNDRVAKAMEATLETMEHDKAVLIEQSQKNTVPAGTFEEKLEPAIQFLASPWKLWETGNTKTRQTMAALLFGGRITYDRFGGPRTTETAFPFKALEALGEPQVWYGAVEKTRTSTGVTPQRPQRCASTNSATTASVTW